MSKFIITLGINNEFYFKLTANNDEPILSSEGYTIKQNCLNGISSVRTNSTLDLRYSRKVASNGQFYFTLHGSNGETIGVSEMYNSTQSRDNGIDSVKRNAPSAIIDDRSMYRAA